MSSNLDNQQLVKQLSEEFPDRVIPCYGGSRFFQPAPPPPLRSATILFRSQLTFATRSAGIHPWFTHPLSLDTPPKPKLDHYSSLLLNTPATASLDLTPLLPTLPDPVPIADFLRSLRANLEAQPHAMLGEVGLDKAFRIPVPLPSEDKKDDDDEPIADAKPVTVSSPLRTSVLATPVEHQLACLRAQIVLAVELRRNVSFHSVRAPEDTVKSLELIKTEVGDDFERIHVCLHSFGGSPETAKRIQQGERGGVVTMSDPILDCFTLEVSS